MKLLDSNLCIALLKKGDLRLVQRFNRESLGIALCSVVKGELLFGARASARVQRNLEVAQELFAGLPSYPFDDAAAEQYAILRAHLKRAGTPIGGNDAMIAAIALAHDLTVVTRNHREFQRVPLLRVEVW